MVQLKSEGGSSPLIQRTIYEFARSDEFSRHVTRVQREYRERREHIVAALAREFTDAAFAVPEGGYYVWLTLPAHIDDALLVARAHHAGVQPHAEKPAYRIG